MKFINALLCALVLLGLYAGSALAVEDQSLTSNDAPTAVDSAPVFLEGRGDDNDDDKDDDAQDAQDAADDAAAAGGVTAPGRFSAHKPKLAPKAAEPKLQPATSVDEVIRNSNEVLNRMASIAKLRNQLSNTMKELLDQLKIPAGLLEGLEKDLAERQKILKELNSEMAALKKQEAVLQKKIDETEARIFELSRQAQLYHGPLAKMRATILTIAKQLNTLQEEVNEAQGTGAAK